MVTTNWGLQGTNKYDMVMPQAWYFWRGEGVRMLAIYYEPQKDAADPKLANASIDRLLPLDQESFAQVKDHDSKVAKCNAAFLHMLKTWVQVLGGGSPTVTTPADFPSQRTKRIMKKTKP
jgi:hypothetical protein